MVLAYITMATASQAGQWEGVRDTEVLICRVPFLWAYSERI